MSHKLGPIRAGVIARNLEATFNQLHPEWTREKLEEFLWGRFANVMPFRYYRPIAEPEKMAFKGLTYDFSKVVTAVLHIGFVSVEETAEHLARLDDAWHGRVSIARSKIGKTEESVKPIDRVARRVANVE